MWLCVERVFLERQTCLGLIILPLFIQASRSQTCRTICACLLWYCIAMTWVCAGVCFGLVLREVNPSALSVVLKLTFRPLQSIKTEFVHFSQIRWTSTCSDEWRRLRRHNNLVSTTKYQTLGATSPDVMLHGYEGCIVDGIIFLIASCKAMEMIAYRLRYWHMTPVLHHAHNLEWWNKNRKVI